MRKLLTLLSFVLFSFYCNAQIEKPITKGNYLIGGSFTGSIKFDSQETSNDSETANVYSIGISPGFGYFIIDGLAIGTHIPVAYGKQNSDENIQDADKYTIGIVPFAKYYFDTGIILMLAGAYEYSKLKYENTILESSYNRFGIETGIGYSFFINAKVSIEPMLNYYFLKGTQTTKHRGFFYDGYDMNFTTETYSVDNKEHSIYISVGFQIFL